MTLPVPPSTNTSFSQEVPGLQLAVDSTSLGEFKICPRKYYYSIICGYQSRQENVHLVFGILLHSGAERYWHFKFDGAGHDEALRRVVKWALGATWNSALRRPWISGDPNKNRLTLIRTLVWHLDQFGANDPLRTVQLASGKPACELSFSFDPGFTETTNGERWLLCGHFDRIAEMNGEKYIVDIKSTKHTIDAGSFKQFSPHNQFSLYVLAGKIAFDQPLKCLIVDLCQIDAGFSRFQRGLVERKESQVDEWLTDTARWVRKMEQCALDGEWEQNDSACGNYGGCQFREICGKPPSTRQQWLDAGFAKRVWDPLQRRGDV